MSTLVLMTALFFFQGNNDLRVQERFRVEYVMLDVSAFDRKGNPVTDLTIDDFEVKEDRKKMDITFFDTLDFRLSSTPDVSKIPVEFREQVQETSTRQIVLAIDLDNVGEVESSKVFHQLNSFLKRLDPEDNYLINVYSMERGSITKGFTDNLALVRESVAELEERHRAGLARARRGGDRGEMLLGDGPRNARPSAFGGRPGRGLGASMLSDDFRFSDLERAFGQCATLYGSDYASKASCIDQTLFDFVDQQKFRSEQVVGQLEILTYAFQEAKGLKMMLFVSPGFALHTMAAAHELANIYKGNRLNSLPATGSGVDIDNEFKRVLHACIKNRVIFHTFDIFNGGEVLDRELGVSFAGAPSGQVRRAYRNYSIDISSGMRELADESGGTYFQTPQLEGVMKKVLERDTYFYQIGYASPQGKPGKYRKIKIKCKRRGVKLRYRTGYFGS